MTVVTSIEDLRVLMKKRVPRMFYDYVDTGSWTESTYRANEADFKPIKFRQRVAVNMENRTLRTQMIGQDVAMPVAIAPTGSTGMMHADGEILAARAAEKFGIPFTLSTMSICSIEDIAAHTKAPFWFQLYVMRDREFVEGLIDRAKAAGCSALMITLDLQVLGQRHRDIKNGLSTPVKPTIPNFMNLALHPRWCLDILRHGVPRMRNFAGAAGARPSTHAALVNSQLDPALSWDIIPWLRGCWKGPLLIKGILTRDDAAEAMARGADGIIISNHGGRQLDGVPSSIRALEQIAPGVGPDVPLFLDGGVRRGSDVVRAVALGAKAVLIGRPTLYAAAAGGADGVRRCLQILFEDMHRTLAHIGRSSMADVDADCLERW